MRIFIFLLLFTNAFLFAHTTPTVVKSKIQKVTVFKSGAHITRMASTNVPKGKVTLKFTGLPPSFDAKSLQLKATGDFTVLAIQHLPKMDTQMINQKPIMYLEHSNDSLGAIIEELDLELKVFVEEELLILNNNKRKEKEVNRLSIEELKSMAAFYRSQLREIRLERLKLQRKIDAHQAKIKQQKQQVSKIKHQQKITKSTEVLVTTLAKQSTKGEFELSYLVNNAGWIPTYDLRVKDIQSPIKVDYKAHVFQHSGEDWDEVKLTLSNANPKQSGEKPNLNKWNLDFYNPTSQPLVKRNYSQTGITYNADGSRTIKGRVFDPEYGREPLIGASVLITGTNIGTSTDFDGYFEIKVPAGYSELEISYTGYSSKKIDLLNTYSYEVGLASGALLLDEVVVTGYSGKQKRNKQQKQEEKLVSQPIEMITRQKVTSVEFQIKEPYTIKKDGEKYTVNIQQLAIPAYYEYYCAPKLDEDVFLTAMISDWEDYNLLSGETNLYFEGTFLGNAMLNVERLQDTISWSLGRDKHIIVERKVLKEYAKKQFVGNKKIENKGIEIEIRNKKNQPINLVLEDQIPVSITDDIEVKIGKYRGATLDQDSRILKWNLKINPESTQKLTFDYSVKYPKRKRIILD